MLNQTMDMYDSDSLHYSSPFHTLSDFTSETSDFDHVEAALMDPYYDMPHVTSSGLGVTDSLELIPSSSCASSSSSSSSPLNVPPYDTLSIVYDNEDLTTYEDYDVISPDTAQNIKQETKPLIGQEMNPLIGQEHTSNVALTQSLNTPIVSYIPKDESLFSFNYSTNNNNTTATLNNTNVTKISISNSINSSSSNNFSSSISQTFGQEEDEHSNNGKGKINELQRRALDAIFSVTDRPSRGLVLHIASELHLHHITVKNFFSNGRRRLRRAAARLNDPERTRRENLRRKEKRKLAALAAAAAKENNSSVSSVASPETNSECSVKETVILSPERRALMEKLADKVHRSAAQKNRLTTIGDPSSSMTMDVQSPFEDTFATLDHHQINLHSHQPSIFAESPVSPQEEPLGPVSTAFVEPFTEMSMDSPLRTFEALVKPETNSDCGFNASLEDSLIQLICESPFQMPPNDHFLTLSNDSPLASPNWAAALLS